MRRLYLTRVAHVTHVVLVATVCLAGCRRRATGEPPSGSTAASSTHTPSTAPSTDTPNAFLGKLGKSPSDAPTFVIGTQGDEAADRIVRGQATMIRGLFFPESEIVDDDAVAAAKGATGWPAHPIVYGGPHVCSALRALGATLPFELGAGKLVLGGETFTGDDVLLVTVVPARAADGEGPGYPEMLVYAGTGTPGVAEINAVGSGRDPILVADRFGILTRGVWVKRGGKLVAELEPRAARATFRSVERPFHGTKVRFSVLADESADGKEPGDEGAYAAAVLRGLDRVVDKLGLEAPSPVDVFLYPDAATKKTWTGNGGDGHAMPSSRTLHVRRFDPSEGGALEGLVAHEGTHVLATAAWGGPGTPALGEGLAVWVSGRYGGVTLDEWRTRLGARPQLAMLLGKGFFALKESESYPAAGLLVDDAVRGVGVGGLHAHLYGATAATWASACEAAGLAGLAKDR